MDNGMTDSERRALEAMAINFRQMRSRVDDLQAQKKAVAELDMPVDSDSNEVFRTKTQRALIALTNLAMRQDAVLSAITRLPKGEGM